MISVDYMEKTLVYYSKWLGEEQILLRDFEEVQYIYSNESAARWNSKSLAKALDLIVEAQRKMVSGSDALLTLEKLVIDLGNC